MQTKLQLKVSPQTAFNEQLLKEEVKLQLQLKDTSNLFIKVLKRSIDARSRSIEINLTVLAFVDEEFTEEKIEFNYLNVTSSKQTCHIIGGGPAGLFAALRCLELGIKPIIIERGKNVKDRRRDLAIINKEHIVKNKIIKKRPGLVHLKSFTQLVPK